ncbi:hypothetical protein A33Q_3931 [Indibacter alkaliphilus LW1]|uniref:SH3 domain-containing protein n=2 Tax=Indibacter TaxID=647744 RepID=S2D6Z9_INDAL|nr:hypothetical protein A33Q_3931 [Indibacter alkaliphilus LW1]
MLNFLLLLTIVFSSHAQKEKPLSITKSKFSDVKVYAQPSTSSPLIMSLEKDEPVDFHRKSIANGGHWSIVNLAGRPGYVLTNELYNEVQPQFSGKVKKSKLKSEVVANLKNLD